MATGEISHEWKEGGAEIREGWLIGKGSKPRTGQVQEWGGFWVIEVADFR